jgi:membrane fusion protein
MAEESRPPPSSEASRRQLFRPEVYDKFGARSEGAVVDMRLPRAASMAALATLIVAALLALLYLGQYARRETVNGIVSTGLGPAKLYAPAIGTVVKRFVEEGDDVNEGDRLFVISTDRATVDTISTQNAIKREIEQRRRTFRADLERHGVLKEIEVRNLRQSLAAGESQDTQITREIELAAARVDTAKLNLDRYRTLASEKYVVESFLIDKQQDLQTQTIQYESLIRQRDGIRKDNESLRNQLAGFATKKAMETAEIQRSLADANQLLADVESRREIIVTSLLSGRVTGLAVDKGSAVTTASVLLSVLPHGDNTDVQLFVPSRAIGFVKVGTQTALRFDAFPYQKFGQYRGTVTKVSTSALLRQEIPVSLAGNEDYYRVWALLDRPYVEAYGERIRVQSGMKVEADMLLEQRRVYEWLIEPLLSFSKTL